MTIFLISGFKGFKGYKRLADWFFSSFLDKTFATFFQFQNFSIEIFSKYANGFQLILIVQMCRKWKPNNCCHNLWKLQLKS